MYYAIQSRYTRIVHLAHAPAESGIIWTYCHQLAVALYDSMPAGYRLCHHCETVRRRYDERDASVLAEGQEVLTS